MFLKRHHAIDDPQDGVASDALWGGAGCFDNDLSAQAEYSGFRNGAVFFFFFSWETLVNPSCC